jgi:hypothetical protein
MPLLLLTLPALVATQLPAASPALDQVQALVGAIPAALLQEKRRAMPGLVVKAKAGWEQARPSLLKIIPGPDATFIDKQFKAMLKMKPPEQAIGAIGISSTLSRFQPRSRKQDLLQVDRLIMAAWTGVDAKQWEPFPNVAAGFKPLIDQDNGQHTLTLIKVKEALKQLDESHKKHQGAEVKKLLKELLNLADLLEKP